MISAIEYAIVNYGASAKLHAVTPELYFVPPIGWCDMDPKAAQQASASRVLLRSEEPAPPFVANVVLQYFSFGEVPPVPVGDLDTTLDFTPLDAAEVLGHQVLDDGFRCVDDAEYTSGGIELRVRRAHLAYEMTDFGSALAIYTATTTITAWNALERDIIEMEEKWRTRTTRIS
ncbi:acetyltransferase [Gordonia rubripertincta]|uniref:acetyltransferase n=1 Tax=Gordonia rubripertincta TaxID=36822 RepID=UPI0015FD870E|nr:acetyltransferase [Gordonia rubripertincta]QMU21524.1 acetyltransferase [Gordonia rubripertincta]